MEFRYDDPSTWNRSVDIEPRLTYVDANTGEWLKFAGEGWPTTDEEAELVLPRPPMYSRGALNLYYGYREEGQSIKDALTSVMRDMEEAWSEADAAG